MRTLTAHILQWASITALAVSIKVSVMAGIAHQNSPRALAYLVISAVVWWLAWEADSNGP